MHLGSEWRLASATSSRLATRMLLSNHTPGAPGPPWWSSQNQGSPGPDPLKTLSDKQQMGRGRDASKQGQAREKMEGRRWEIFNYSRHLILKLCVTDQVFRLVPFLSSVAPPCSTTKLCPPPRRSALAAGGIWRDLALQMAVEDPSQAFRGHLPGLPMGAEGDHRG